MSKKQTAKPKLTPENIKPAPLHAMGGIFSEAFGDVFRNKPTTKEQHPDCEECNTVDFITALMECKKAFFRLSVMLPLLHDVIAKPEVDFTRAYVLLTECEILARDGQEAIDGSGLQL